MNALCEGAHGYVDGKPPPVNVGWQTNEEALAESAALSLSAGCPPLALRMDKARLSCLVATREKGVNLF